MKKTIRAMLLSGLVFPGLGQIYLGRKKLGAFLSGSVFGLLLWLVIRIFLLTWRAVVVKTSAEIGLNLSPEVLSRLHHQAWAGNWWLVLMIVLFWAFSIWEARRN